MKKKFIILYVLISFSSGYNSHVEAKLSTKLYLLY